MKRLCIVIIMCVLAMAATPQRQKATRKKARTTKVAKKRATKRTTRKTTSIAGLKNQRAEISRQIRTQERKLRTNERDVKKRLQNLMVINSEISDKKKSIDTIRRDISTLNTDIQTMDRQLKELGAQLDDRKDKFVKSMRYMHRNSSIQSQLMFVFSAKNFSQMYRRMRFMREYATYQKAQGELVKSKQREVAEKKRQLAQAKTKKTSLLERGEQERRNLETKQTEQQSVVASLKRQNKTIQGIIAEQRKKDAAINAQIDRLVAIEVEKARQRAIAEAKRKAEAEARRKREAEQARRKAEADEARRGRAEAAAPRSRKEEARETARKPEPMMMDSEDRRISGSFAGNRGRLPMPVAGPCRIVSHFGKYNVEGLRNVRLDNKGINIQGQAGARVRSIFDGEVSAVFSLGGTTGVMVRHGSYISVYCNLGSVSVSRGQKVSTRQTLGTVGQDNILQFQLRREKAKLNPEVWLGR